MIVLEASLDLTTVTQPTLRPSAWGEATVSELRYDCFLGDVTFRVGAADFSTHWGWIPMWDFALAMCGSIASLNGRDESCFEFTESEACIIFSRRDHKIEVAATYAPRVVGRTCIGELASAAYDFLVCIDGRLLRAYPELRDNPGYRRLTTAALGAIYAAANGDSEAPQV